MKHVVLSMLSLITSTSMFAAVTLAQLQFEDSFDGDLSAWEVLGQDAVSIQDVGGPDHGPVLVLECNGWDVAALVRGSERWGALSVEADILFPQEGHSYLGALYHYRRENGRTDFGNIYIKGNGSYIRVNPHRDGNVGRTLYEDLRTPLRDAAEIRIGEWKHIKLEVVGSAAHLYVGDMQTPQVMFPFYEGTAGQVGFHPRSVGDPVWVDNVRVRSIQGFSYQGAPIPDLAVYAPQSLLADWQVVGPRTHHDDGIARNPQNHIWRPALVDGRGAVVTAAVTDFAGDRTVAYFKTTFESPAAGEATLLMSTVDNLALWINGRFRGFIPRHDHAWYDFWYNADHEGWDISIDVRAGRNEIVVRAQGGQYATGGFFARVEDLPARAGSH